MHDSAADICVGINNLPGADGQPRVTWPLAVRKALMQTDLEQALSCITQAQLAGAHNYLLLSADGRGYHVEAFSTATHVTELGDDVLVHTNHALAELTRAVSRRRPDELQASSEARLETGRAALVSGTVGLDELTRLLQHPTVCYRGAPPFYLETCGAAIMRPQSGELWACWGLPSERESSSGSRSQAPYHGGHARHDGNARRSGSREGRIAQVSGGDSR